MSVVVAAAAVAAAKVVLAEQQLQLAEAVSPFTVIMSLPHLMF